MRCLHAFFHKWAKWTAPEPYRRGDPTLGLVTAVQRQECERCGAVRYRRVLVETRG